MSNKLFIKQIDSILEKTKFNLEKGDNDVYIMSYDYEEYYFNVLRNKLNKKIF